MNSTTALAPSTFTVITLDSIIYDYW